MPPRLPLRASAARSDLLGPRARSDGQAVCFFCSLSPRPACPVPETRRPRRKALNGHRRLQSTTPAARPPADARRELEDALVDLQKHAANFVNLSRVQLALNGLRQQPGNESIRVAILGLTNGTSAGETAKQVLKLLLADPLKDEEAWEKEVDQYDLAGPMIARVGPEGERELSPLSTAKNNLLHEVHVSSATLNNYNLEILLMESNPYTSSPEEGVEGFEKSVLVPTVDIPSATTRISPITTPVHKTILVTDGIMSAASIAQLPLVESQDFVKAVVNMPEYKAADASDLPFTPVDVGTARVGLGLIRKSLNDAMEYERLWFQSNMPKLVDWLKADVASTADAATKPPVRRLIASLLQHASTSIEREEAQRLTSVLSSTTSTSVRHLRANLADWAEGAHTELQEQLDLAFSSRRWRKLGWWKLFWRVDDVHMLTSDIINQRFLPHSEKNVIYLAGRIQEAHAGSRVPVLYEAPSTGDADVAEKQATRWPTNIIATKSYLQNETIPALQALAQKLVFQTLSTSGLTSALGAMAYFGTLTTGIYEAGAVAALGIVWSMRRMQTKWEAARKYWEGEVREEGRKAVQGVETAVRKTLDGTSLVQPGEGDKANADLAKVKQLVEKATEALGKLK
jgi:hypothetical protein